MKQLHGMCKITHISFYFFLAITSVLPQVLYADAPKMKKAKSELKQLDYKITHLKQNLSSAQDKTIEITKELARTEKKIGDCIAKLRHIEGQINISQTSIKTLENEIEQLTKTLKDQQSLLAKHIRARYMMGEYQPLKWLLNLDNPTQTSRLLTFHQYIIKSRQHMIENVQKTQKKLAMSQTTLHQKMLVQQQLQQELKKQQHTLAEEKRHNTTVIQSINKDIQNKQQTLVQFQRNRDNLTQLLKTLTQQSAALPRFPFISMRKKLPYPLKTTRQNIHILNQGLIFFASEGTPVDAVYPGKVVFSDWLNGYGLLLIIDHGRGFMTLYAHNQSLFKQKGSVVNQGEQIASVGHTGGIKQNGLYFEIRQRGKAVPPLNWLPST